MKINRINHISNIYKANQMQSINKKVLNKKDSVELSTTAHDFQVAKKALKKVPDIRKEKVDEIKERIDSHQYDINSKEIAKKMLENKGRVEWRA